MLGSFMVSIQYLVHLINKISRSYHAEVADPRVEWVRVKSVKNDHGFDLGPVSFRSWVPRRDVEARMIWAIFVLLHDKSLFEERQRALDFVMDEMAREEDLDRLEVWRDFLYLLIHPIEDQLYKGVMTDVIAELDFHIQRTRRALEISANLN